MKRQKDTLRFWESLLNKDIEIELSNIIPREYYLNPTIEVAKGLIGDILVRIINGEILAGIIVETEAYLKDDPACHAFYGRTPKNEVMFGPPGYAYVYTVHKSHCLNIVTGEENIPEAVLIRALEPIKGIELMKKFRRRENIKELCSGPGKLCEALNITREELNGYDVTKHGKLFVVKGEKREREIVARPRIGIKVAVDKLWRFYEKGNPFVSKK